MHWTGIHNENEFYSEHYLAEIFAGDVRGVLEDWTRREQAARERARAQGRTEPDWRALHNRLAAQARDALQTLEEIGRSRDPRLRLELGRVLLRRWLQVFELPWHPERRPVAGSEEVELPLLGELKHPDGGPLLWVLEAQPLADGHDLDADPLSLPFRPWRHQVTAFRRLDPAAPRSTLIATGTGSGKTECFMLPILEYCLRHRQPGIKAIIVYPMNALATDQARRFAREVARLDTKLSVGLFTGDDGGDNRCMTPQQVITHRDTLREHPPDILLTNYKMLDFLLLRPRDQRLWRHNRPGTLRYLVVDELHTFDGVQGTDLACLIRRLRDRLGAGPELACVGTSATLGGTEAKQALADYACKIFAAPFDEEAVVMEERLAVEDYLRSLGAEAAPPADWPTDSIEALRPGHLPAGEWLREAARIWLGEDLPLDAREREEYERAAVRLGELLGRHTAFHALVRAAAGLCDLNRLAADWAERLGLAGAEEGRVLLDSLCALVAAARIRTPEGKLRPFLQLRVQLWVRELRRMLASVSRAPVLRHADDLQDLAAPLHLPLLHCRECHATAWGGVLPEWGAPPQARLAAFLYRLVWPPSRGGAVLSPGGPLRFAPRPGAVPVPPVSPPGPPGGGGAALFPVRLAGGAGGVGAAAQRAPGDRPGGAGAGEPRLPLLRGG